MSLTNRIALVTGGGGALGNAVVHAFLGAGASVRVPYVVADEVPRLRARAGEHAARLTCLAADVGNPADVRSLVRGVVERDGGIDVLVHLVGGFWGGVPVAETPDEQWDAMWNLNLRTFFLCAREVVPHMQKRGGGCIVAVSSRAGLQGAGNYAAYSVAKGAVITLAQALAEETRAFGVRVNVVAPSTIDTPANRRAMPDADHSKWVAPEAIAKVIAFLCSGDAAPVSGAVVPVYGDA